MPPFDVPYTEKLEVGYKWFDAENKEPLFAFGHGLSYTTFAYSGLQRRGRGPQRDRVFHGEEHRQARRQGNRAGIRDASGECRRATQEADRLAEGGAGARVRARRSTSRSTRCTFPSLTRARTALRSSAATTRSGQGVRPGTCHCRRACRSATESRGARFQRTVSALQRTRSVPTSRGESALSAVQRQPQRPQPPVQFNVDMVFRNNMFYIEGTARYGHRAAQIACRTTLGR